MATDARSGGPRALQARVTACAGALVIAICAAAAVPVRSQTVDGDPQLPHRLQPGVALAQACEPDIDADLSHYVRCIDSAQAHHRERLGADARIGLLFQAWLMADLAVQQDSDGAAQARQRWWADLQQALRSRRLALDDVSLLAPRF